MEQFDGIEREVGERIDLGIIWLHGLGADASDFLPIVAELSLPVGVRFVFPNAPRRPVTINGGMVMRAWYDIRGFGPDAPDDRAGLSTSIGIVDALIEREIARGLAEDRIVLAGFSQGGAVALQAGLGSSRRLAGILGLSTYLPAPDLLESGSAVATEIPVMLAHGTHDPILPLALAERAAGALTALGVRVDFETYPMGHEVSMAEIRDISEWLARIASR